MENNQATFGRKLLMFLVMVVIAALILAGLYYWMNLKDEVAPVSTPVFKPADAEQQINFESRALMTATDIVFPEVVKSTLIDESAIPEKTRGLITGGAVNIEAYKIDYAKSQTGFFIKYIVASVDAKDFIYDHARYAVGGSWAQTKGTSAALTAISDLQTADSKAVAQARFVQKGTDVQVIIKTLNK